MLRSDSRQARTRGDTAAGEAAWCVYIVECADRSLYTGIARNVTLRVVQHNDGSGARYTRSRRPVRLVHVEVAGDRGSALRREFAIKQLSAAAKRRLTRGYNPPRGAREDK